MIVAPLASVGLAHVTAEPGAAKGAAKAGSIFSISTYSSTPIKELQINMMLAGTKDIEAIKKTDSTQMMISRRVRNNKVIAN